MRLAFREHRAHLWVLTIIIAVGLSAIMANKIVPLDMQPNLPPRPWPVVEIISILAYACLFYLSSSRIFPFGSSAPRSRDIRLWESVLPVVFALSIGLFGAWRLQASQPGPIQWQTIVVNVALVAGSTMCLVVLFNLETAIALTLLGYFALVLAQTGLEPALAGRLPLARISGPGPWFDVPLVVLATALTTLGIGLTVRRPRTPMRPPTQD